MVFRSLKNIVMYISNIHHEIVMCLFFFSLCSRLDMNQAHLTGSERVKWNLTVRVKGHHLGFSRIILAIEVKRNSILKFKSQKLHELYVDKIQFWIFKKLFSMFIFKQL